MSLPARIGPYDLVHRLGQGGMGEVWLAHDDRLKRHVALKSLIAADRRGQSALVHEARAAAALSHSGIAAIYDILQDGDRTYIVMEYAEGDTLAARLRQGPLPAAEAHDIGAQLCDALGAAHARQIIHRDLKPGNIIIGPGNRAKILDFGLARHDPAASLGASTTTAASIVGGSMAGTVGYIAPEQMLGKPIDHRADIYSLGTVLFEMFTGQRPFRERTGVAYALAATRERAPSARDVNASVSEATAAVIARAIATDPNDRYADAAELGRALRAASFGSTATAPSPPMPPRYTPRAMAALVSLTLVVLATIGYVAWPRSAVPAGTAASPAVMAIMPVMTFDLDESTEAIGAGITATIFSNLSGTSGLNVIPLSAVSQLAASSDRTTALKTLGVSWALETSLRRGGTAFTLDASLTQPGADEPIWRTRVTGDALTTERRLVDALARGLVSAGVVASLSSADRERLVRAPTNDNDAFVAYSRGRRLLVRPWSPATAPEMLRFLQEAVERDPGYALAHAALSEAYFANYRQTKDPILVEHANEAARRAIALDPGQAAVQVSLATIRLQTGQLQDALAAADRAIELMPASDDAQRLRGRILGALGRYDEAIAALSRAVALNPLRMNNHETLGFVLYQAGRLREAVESYRRVTEIAPTYAAGFEMLGTMQHMMGNTTLAIGNYEHAARLGQTANAYANLAYSYYEAGRFEEALKAYQTAIERDPKFVDSYRNLGDVYMRLGRTADARRAYEMALATADGQLRVNPSNAALIALVALCEAKLGRDAAAERHAAEALALQPKDRNVVIKNAEVFANLGQRDRALEYLRQAIALGYDAATARKNDEFASLRNTPAFATVIAAAPSPPQ
jgi:serine/threonine-protein kinase